MEDHMTFKPPPPFLRKVEPAVEAESAVEAEPAVEAKPAVKAGPAVKTEKSDSPFGFQSAIAHFDQHGRSSALNRYFKSEASLS
ncbi:hypothetical protein OUZ56_009683 [Daphnia magna]|uniref:Uncharacterized protein n=1 Tax=Daphnia magna TaxID=35525 RepID=A0ABR0AGP3_9CRUS|nr:hypothetical protein OUZ56_009683 [Daphnia magna]